MKDDGGDALWWWIVTVIMLFTILAFGAAECRSQARCEARGGSYVDPRVGLRGKCVEPRR